MEYKGTFKRKKKKKRLAAVSGEEIPNITGSGSTLPGRAISSSSTAALEVKNGRAKATLEGCITAKEAKSKYGVDPKNVEKQVAEIWTVEQGLTLCRFPAPRHLIKLHPLQTVSNWSDWIREQVEEIPGWQDKSVDLRDDYTRDAHLGMTPLIGKSTLTTITLDDYKIQSLLREFPDQSKAGIVFVVPVCQPQLKPKKDKRESRSSDFLQTPLPKRQKSPIGCPIRRGA